MKSVYVCGNFKFLSQIEELENMLTKENIVFMVSKSLDAHGILGCLERIDQADVVYVVNPKGYV